MLKFACLVVVCAIVIVQCQGKFFVRDLTNESILPSNLCIVAKKPHDKPDEDSHEDKGGFGKHPPQKHGKGGDVGFLSKGFGSENDGTYPFVVLRRDSFWYFLIFEIDVNVNVNVRVGGAQQRPQWFGHRPGKGPKHDEDDESDEHKGPHGGRPRPPHEEDSSSEEGKGEDRPHRPHPETNGTKYEQ